MIFRWKKIKKIITRLIKKAFNIFGLDIVRLKHEHLPKSQPISDFLPYFIDNEVEGEKFNFFIGDTDGKALYDNGNYPINLEMRFLKEMIIQKDDIVFDVGSHHCYTTIFFSKWVGEQGKVIAFEPNPANFEIEKINLASNSIKNVKLINSAVGMKSGKIQIDISTSNSSILFDRSKKINLIRLKLLI